jgi:hypothetical protein
MSREYGHFVPVLITTVKRPVFTLGVRTVTGDMGGRREGVIIQPDCHILF